MTRCFENCFFVKDHSVKFSTGLFSGTLRTNLALCCAACRVLCLSLLFGRFSAYFPIPFSIHLGVRIYSCYHSYPIARNCKRCNVVFRVLNVSGKFAPPTAAVTRLINKFGEFKSVGVVDKFIWNTKTKENAGVFHDQILVFQSSVVNERTLCMLSERLIV